MSIINCIIPVYIYKDKKIKEKTPRYILFESLIGKYVYFTATYSRTSMVVGVGKQVCIDSIYIDGIYYGDHLWLAIENDVKLGGGEIVSFSGVLVKRLRPSKSIYEKPVLDIALKEPVKIVSIQRH